MAKLKAEPYEIGAFGEMPDLQPARPSCEKKLAGSRQIQGAVKVPGMCQLCSNVCGMIGYVKDGRLLKVEGNPRDPNSRGYLRRGQASLNHLYHRAIALSVETSGQTWRGKVETHQLG